MKRVRFLGDSLKAKAFPVESRKAAGFELKRIQSGLAPNDSKPMPSLGQGVEEIRIWGESGTFSRYVYGQDGGLRVRPARISEEIAANE